MQGSDVNNLLSEWILYSEVKVRNNNRVTANIAKKLNQNLKNKQ